MPGSSFIGPDRVESHARPLRRSPGLARRSAAPSPGMPASRAARGPSRPTRVIEGADPPVHIRRRRGRRRCTARGARAGRRTRASISTASREGVGPEHLAADVGVHAEQTRRPGDAPERSTASAAAPEARPKPNFESSWPVRTNSWVCASTPGVTRTSTPTGANLPLRPIEERLEPVDLVEGVDDDPADPGVETPLDSSASSLLLPWSTMRSRWNPGRERDVQLAAGRDIEAHPLLDARAAPSPCTGTPWSHTRRRRPTLDAPRGSARGGGPRRRRTAASRTRSARSSRSDPRDRAAPASRRSGVVRQAGRGRSGPRGLRAERALSCSHGFGSASTPSTPSPIESPISRRLDQPQTRLADVVADVVRRGPGSRGKSRGNARRGGAPRPSPCEEPGRALPRRSRRAAPRGTAATRARARTRARPDRRRSIGRRSIPRSAATLPIDEIRACAYWT